jgi:hypothetical protein
MNISHKPNHVKLKSLSFFIYLCYLIYIFFIGNEQLLVAVLFPAKVLSLLLIV